MSGAKSLDIFWNPNYNHDVHIYNKCLSVKREEKYNENGTEQKGAMGENSA